MLQPSSSPARRNLLGWVSLCALILVVGFREIRSTVLAKELESGFLKLEEKTRTLPQGEIVFTGASSVAYWDSLGSDMKPLQVVNTAYGGAEYTDLNPQIDKLVVAYHPVAVVVYAGDNDLATPSSKTPQSVAGDAMHFVDLVHAQLPNTWVYVMSIKPSYARWDAWPKMKEADGLIQQELRGKDHAEFIDVATPMFGSASKPPRDFFISDGLHPSAKCYVVWTVAIKPVLLKRFGSAATSAQ
jgi:lysophospholipase L1-like esterase